MAQEFGGFVDSHVHYYGEGGRDPLQVWAEELGETHWLRLTRNGPQGWAKLDKLLTDMDIAGVEMAILVGWYWETPAACEQQNKWIGEAVQLHPDRFRGMAAYHPEMVSPEAMLGPCLEWEPVGVGELLPQVQTSLGWSHSGWQRLLEWTGKAELPILLHVTEPVGHVYPGRVQTPLEELIEILEAWNEQRWILAHWGGGLPFYCLNRRIVKALANCWFDSAASSLLYDNRVWKIVSDLVGAERILFGSDYPLRVRPRIQSEADFLSALEIFQCSELPSAARRAIGRQNAAKLFSLRD